MPSALLFALLLSINEPQQNVADPPDQSVERIRKALSNQPLKIDAPGVEPTFRVSVRQERLFEAPWRRDEWNDGHIPPGGLYAFEQRQRLGNPWAGQPLIQVDVLPAAERLINLVKDARRARNEHAAHEEVLRAVALFCIANRCETPEHLER